MAKQPNIVLFVADQFRGDALGCDGNAQIRTPRYDELAASGVRFRHAFTPCPICVPARATMISGNYPHKCTGFKTNTGALKDDQIELPRLLSAHGYETYSAGKLHYLPYMPPGEPRTLHGFQHATLAESGRIIAQYDPSGRTPGLEDYFDALGEVGWQGYSRAHGIGNNDIHPAASPLPPEHTVDAWVATESIRYIDEHRERASDKPFFLHVSFPKPHSPFDPPRPYDSLYDPRELDPPLTQRDPHPRTPFIDEQNKKHGWHYFSPEARQVIKSHYYGLITFQDEQVGRVIDHLKFTGQYDNTVFIFVADHGEMLGDFGAYFKAVMYEGSVRVPFIVAGAGVTVAGTVSDELVGLQDLLPTIADIAGTKLPHAVDGVSLMPVLKGEDFTPRSEYIAYALDSPQQTAMVRTKTHKYIYNEMNGVEELYNLAEDPNELQNQVADPAHADRVASMRQKLIDWAIKNGDEAILVDGQLATSSYEPASATFEASAMGWRHY